MTSAYVRAVRGSATLPVSGRQWRLQEAPQLINDSADVRTVARSAMPAECSRQWRLHTALLLTSGLRLHTRGIRDAPSTQSPVATAYSTAAHERSLPTCTYSGDPRRSLHAVASGDCK